MHLKDYIAKQKQFAEHFVSVGLDYRCHCNQDALVNQIFFLPVLQSSPQLVLDRDMSGRTGLMEVARWLVRVIGTLILRYRASWLQTTLRVTSAVQDTGD